MSNTHYHVNNRKLSNNFNSCLLKLKIVFIEAMNIVD